MDALKDVKTCDLVIELAKREGVEEIWAEPHEQKILEVNGPARILIIID